MRVATFIAFVISSMAQTEPPAWCKSPPRPEYNNLTRVPTNQNWFDVYSIADGTYAIHEPRQSQQTISYLITGRTRALLFDTGMGIGDLRRVVEELTKLPVSVLNSHTHHDHVGSNWQFDTVFGMDTPFTRQNAKGSREEAQAEIAPSQICGELPKGFDPKSYETRAWSMKETRRDGDQIDLGGRTVEVIATPGHTPDSICLLDRANGLLFTGDTYYRGTIWLYRAETDLDAYAKSIARLAALEPEIRNVAGAHNVPTAPASVLGELVRSFQAVQDGKVTPTLGTQNRARYNAGSVSFLMRAK